MVKELQGVKNFYVLLIGQCDIFITSGGMEKKVLTVQERTTIGDAALMTTNNVS